MTKYNIFATKLDWEKFYSKVNKYFPEMIKEFKKSSSLDSAEFTLHALLRHKKGLSYEQANQIIKA